MPRFGEMARFVGVAGVSRTICQLSLVLPLPLFVRDMAELDLSAIYLRDRNRIGYFTGVKSLGRITVQTVVLFTLLSLLHVQGAFAREALVCCSFPLATIVVLLAARVSAIQSAIARGSVVVKGGVGL